ncbi:4505_t:CDS:2, partial [Gigaspora margarita]
IVNPFTNFDLKFNEPNYIRTLDFEHIYVINLDYRIDIKESVSNYDHEAFSRLNSDLNDVDMELNITDIMTEVHRYLPNDWDMLYLGHCADSRSRYFETDLTVHVLHKLVSAKGVKKLLKKLDIDSTNHHIDQDIPALIMANEIIIYSVFPHTIIQFKVVSD